MRKTEMEELDKTMYFNARPSTMEAARLLRKQTAHIEEILWEKLKGKQILGLRFRRQHPIDLFIVDFYCHKVRLVVEIDGEIHNYQREYDIGRTAELEKFDIKVIRFSNVEVILDIEKVISKIKMTVKDKL
jgi:very-short-patch-repair endonuclease